jgi:hypothetical protein
MRNYHVSKTKNSSPEDKTFEPRPLSNIGATKRKPGNRFHISTMTPAPLTTLPSGVIADAHYYTFHVSMRRAFGGRNNHTVKVVESLFLRNSTLFEQWVIVAEHRV